MRFTAICVESNMDGASANVLFADPEANPDEPLVLMLSHSVEFQDSRYYFEFNGQEYGRYGGLTLVQVSRDNLEVHLEPDVVKDFGGESFAEGQVNFDIDDKSFQSMADTLKTIFANSNVLVLK